MKIRKRCHAFTAMAAALCSVVGASPQASQAQTPLTLTVPSGGRQTFGGIGTSIGNFGGEYQTLSAANRTLLSQLMWRDTKFKVMRLWFNQDDYSPTPGARDLSTFRHWYINSGVIADAMANGVNTFVIGPDHYPPYMVPGSDKWKGPIDNTQVENFATVIADGIKQIVDETGITIAATGIQNEPTFTPAQVVRAVKALRAELDARGLQQIKVIAPEASSVDSSFFNMVDAVKADPVAWGALGGIGSHSYNMAATDQAAAYVSANPDGSNLKDYWMTESSDNGTEDPAMTGIAALRGANVAARFLNDMNHRVTHWMHFLGFENSGNGSDDATRIIPFTPSPFSYEILKKYFYYQQLGQGFDQGAVFRDTNSSLDGDMTYTFGKKPHLIAATARNPDGTWTVGIQNFTANSFSGLQGSADEGWNSSQGGYTPATPYSVTVNINELAGLGSQVFNVRRTNDTQVNAAAGTATMNNGLLTITVDPLELVTLRSATATATPAPTPAPTGQIRFFPRSGFADRMVGGQFQGSNGDPVNGPWITIASVPTLPTAGVWTTIPNVQVSGYTYLRYFGASYSHSNVAEIEFSDNGTVLTGTRYGTAAYAGGMEYDKAFDGSTSTAFDASAESGSYTGLVISQVGNPTVSLTAPANGTSYTSGATVNLAANASDSDGTITKVQFFQNSTLLGEDFAAPYTFAWTNVPTGNYGVSARAFDNSNKVVTSAGVAINVSNGAIPTVNLTAPYNGQAYPAGSVINLAANAADTDGTITQVQFFRGGTTLIGTDTTAPYTFAWSGAAAGNYSITAKATDSSGNVVTSSAASVTMYGTTAAPSVSLTSPANGATFSAGSGTISLTASASDSDGSIAKVEFFRGTTSLGIDATAPYNALWVNPTPGSYSLTARATDNTGMVTTSAPVNVTINLPTTGEIRFFPRQYQPVRMKNGQFQGTNGDPANGPWTTIATVTTTPTDGVWNSVVAPVTLNYTYLRFIGEDLGAAGLYSNVAEIEFYSNGVKVVGTPYGSPGQSAETGPEKAFDGNVGTFFDSATASGGYTGLAVGVVNTPPTVSITSPANGTAYTVGAPVSLAANAADSNGTVSKVEFYSNGVLIGTDTTSPYTLAWTAPMANGTYSITAKATDNEGAVTTSTAISITVTGGNTPPAVSLTSPTNGQVFSLGTTINLAATATDSDGTIAQVQFYAGSTLLSTDTTAPYAYSWTGATAGTYSLTAKATDNSGAVVVSSAIGFTVQGPNTAPSVSLTSPTNGQNFSTVNSIGLVANASDSDGTVTQVQFYAGATLLSTDTSAPYSFTWSGAAAGTYSLTAKATDNSGATTTSAAVTITVTQAGQIRFFPRAAQAGRMVGGIFQGSNGDAATGPWTDIATITTTPTNGVWNSIVAPLTISYNYLRYVGPSNGYGNVAEIEFYSNNVKINGTPYGTAPYAPGTEYDKAFDGNTSTFFDSAVPTGGYTGIALNVATPTPTPTPTPATPTPATPTPATPTPATPTPATPTPATPTPATPTPATPTPVTGGVISREVWTNVGGNNVSDIPLGTTPNTTDTLTSMEGPTDWADTYATRLRGYITAPTTGSYTFWTAGDDAVELWLSTNNSPTNKVKIAFNSSYTSVRGWNGQGSQKSAAVTLTAGQQYYVEVLHKEGGGGDHFAIGWAKPGEGTTTPSQVVPGSVLSPFTSVPNNAPTVSLTSPSNGATYTAGATINLAATAADSDGTVTQVQFYAGSTLLSTDTTAPYAYSWTGATAGTYSLTAKATDNNGATTNSAAVSITVNAAGNVAPTVSLTSPANGSVFTVGATVNIAANAADSNGTVTQVQFYQGSTLLSTDTTSPYAYSWTPAVGTYSLTAKATDNAGAVTTSSAVSITVNAAGGTVNGSVTREVWTSVPGSTVADIPVGLTPNITDTLTSLEAPSNWADSYGTRIKGFITAPTTGSYTFWIAGDDAGQFWLSTDSSPANKVQRCSFYEWVGSWNQQVGQKSTTISLTAGQKYYFEILHKEGAGGDSVAVGWLKPGQTGTVPSEVVPSSVLSH